MMRASSKEMREAPESSLHVIVRTPLREFRHSFLDCQQQAGASGTTLHASSHASLLTNSYTIAHSHRALVLLEHEGDVTEPSSLSALTAVQRLGGSLTSLVVGSPDQSSKKAKKYIWLLVSRNGFLKWTCR